MLEEGTGVLRPNRLQCSAYRRDQRFAGARPGFALQRLKPGEGFFHGVEVGLVWRQPGCVARGSNSHTFLHWCTDWRTAPALLLGERCDELAAECGDVGDDAAPDQVSLAEGGFVNPGGSCVL